MAVELTGADVALESDDSFERLGMALDELPRDGYIDDDENVPVRGERRARISRTFLWLLGYLKKDNGRAEPDNDYRQAVENFHLDLGLAPAVTLSDEGWEALRELGQFDTDVDVTRWLANANARRVLERAVRLRLFSYGLITTRSSAKRFDGKKLAKARRELGSALDDFTRVVSRLRLMDTHPETGFNEPLLRLLFSHEELTKRIKWKDDGYQVFSAHPRLPIDETTASKLSKRFVGNLALVELWLLGYDVRPGNFKPDSAHSREGDGTLHAALDRFAKDRNLKGVNTDQIKVGQWFFDEARRIRDQSPESAAVPEGDLNQIIADRTTREDLQKSYKSLGARILDGVKRAVSWVVGFFRKAAQVVRRLIRNVARVIHKGVTPIFNYLKAMFRVTALGFSYFLRSPVAGSSTGAVYVRKRLDFDLEVFISANANPEEVDRFFDILDLIVRAMSLGGRIIGRLWELISMVIRVSNAVIGWLSLILTLMKFGNWVRSIVGLAQESHALITEMDELAAEVG